MTPKRVDIELWTDGAFDEIFEVTRDGAPQDFTGWQFKMVFADSFFAESPLFEATVDASVPGALHPHVETSVIAPLLPNSANKTQLDLAYVLKAKPAGVDYPVRLFYGTARLRKGLPPWL